MELTAGYKQTELGTIPEEWDCRTLEDLTDPARPIGYGIVQTGKSVPNGIKCVRVVDMVAGNIDSEQLITTTSEISQAYKRTLLRENDLIIALRGKIGAVAVIGEELVGANLTRGVALLSASDNIHSSYLAQYLASTVGKNTIEKSLNGSALQEIPIAALRKILAVTPTPPEQRAISTALSDVDALIAGLERLIAKKRDIKQAAMQQLLTGQTRLPGFKGEWASVQIGDLLSVCHGKSQREVEVLDGPYPILATGGQIGTAIQPLHDRPSVLIGRKGTINKPQYMDTPFWTVDTLFYCDVHQLNSAKFLYYRFLLIDWMQYNEASGVPSLNGRTIERVEIECPDSKEQAAIAAVLSDMDAELSALESRLAKTRAIKQGMMQELLTGRTRLVDSVEQAHFQKTEPTEERKANVYFMRSVLAAEIVDQLHQEPTFGHVKFEKMMFLAEHLYQVDTGSHYARKAAGPLDRQALHSIDSQLRKQAWFDVRKENGRYRYVPLEKRGGHRPYFDRYFARIRTQLSEILETFRSWETERCEIVATLYAAWNDLLREKGSVSDDLIVHEVLNNWHESKQRISEERWLKALGWMREKGYVPGPVAEPDSR